MHNIYNNVRAWSAACLLVMLCFCSCKDEVAATFNPYTNWAARNDAWFRQVCEQARQSIADPDSVAKYGDSIWRNEKCDWRMYKSLLKSASFDSQLLTDSICVHIIERGTDAGAYKPTYSDSVRLHFAGWLLETTYRTYDNRDTVYQKSFTKSYQGEFDPELAAPQLMSVSSTVPGFCTALQYMQEGDTWDVYIPQNLGYGSSSNASIPAYSTLLFRINMVAAYPAGSGIPTWK